MYDLLLFLLLILLPLPLCLPPSSKTRQNTMPSDNDAMFRAVNKQLVIL